MASSFPGAIDNFTDPLANSSLASPSHAGQHSDLNDAVEKIETYMGLVKVIPTGATNGTVSANGTVTIGNAVSSVTVSGAFSSLYDAYKIIISGGVASTDTDLQLTLGAAAAGYYAGYSRVTYSTGAAAPASNNGASSWTRGGSGTTDVLFSHVDLINPFATKRTIINGFTAFQGTAFSGGVIGGFLDTATSYTSFTYTVASGTITGGTIRVYGYRN